MRDREVGCSQKRDFASSFGFSRTVNLSGILSYGVDLVIIIGSRFVTYTFGSRFIYKHWVGISIKI